MSLLGIAGLLGMLCIGGCVLYSSSVETLDVVDFRASDTRRNVLVVFLPGISDRADDFERFGFVQAVRHSRQPLDMIAVDARLSHYLSQQFAQRLRQEVILPARQQGYAQIWLVGISLGGMGSMLYARENPLDIDGVIAIAPYMGDGNLVEAVNAAGGPLNWQPGPTLPGDFRPDAWLWLKDYQTDRDPPVFILAYGQDDRFAKAHGIIASMLPSNRIVCLPGGHDWGTWLRLWSTILHNPEFDLSTLWSAGSAAQEFLPETSTLASHASTAVNASFNNDCQPSRACLHQQR